MEITKYHKAIVKGCLHCFHHDIEQHVERIIGRETDALVYIQLVDNEYKVKVINEQNEAEDLLVLIQPNQVIFDGDGRIIVAAKLDGSFQLLEYVKIKITPEKLEKLYQDYKNQWEKIDKIKYNLLSKRREKNKALAEKFKSIEDEETRNAALECLRIARGVADSPYNDFRAEYVLNDMAQFSDVKKLHPITFEKEFEENFKNEQ